MAEWQGGKKKDKINENCTESFHENALTKFIKVIKRPFKC